VARQTRAQRRARRAQAVRDGAQVERPRAAQPAQPRAARAAPPSRDGGAAVERHLPGSGTRRFISESWGELKKVEWPGQNQLIQGVVVVLVACLIVGIFLYASDLVFKRVVQNVFLGQ
jgi:preprotein translocase subunit SecE